MQQSRKRSKIYRINS